MNQPERASVRFPQLKLRPSHDVMTNNDEPLAFFITWTVYGTHLQGHEQGWRRRKKGTQPPQPLLEGWRHDRLNHPVIVLDADMRVIV
ncbi:MAG TPA: hypothetical protein VIY86_11515, partial [Pirellulaceae bacterium]